MKKFIYLEKTIKLSHLMTVILLSVIFVVFSGCTNFINEQTNYNNKSVTLNVTSDEGLVLFDEADIYSGLYEQVNSSRMILPSYSSTTLVYYLTYKNMRKTSDWNVEKNIPFKASSATTGSISKNFEPSYYNFTLYALTQEKAADMEASYVQLSDNILIYYSSFKASTFADFNYSEEVFFHLKPNNLSSGTGTFSISISHYNGWTLDGQYKLTVGLYEKDTERLIYPSTNPIVIRDYKLGSQTIQNYLFDSGDTKIPTGSYDLILNYQLLDDDKNVLNEFKYTEDVVIFMNQNSSGSVEIPYFLNSVPEAPSCFIAGYKLPADSTDFYEVQFKWFDNSCIEEGFKLELINVSGDASLLSPKNDDDWNTLKSNYGKGTVNGHLTASVAIFSLNETANRNAGEISLKLPLGTRYIGRLCASNSVGNSNWTYLILPQTLTYTDPSDSNQSATLDSGYLCFDDDVTTLNLYKVTYETNHGTFETKDASGNIISNPQIVEYQSQHNLDANTKAASTTKYQVLTPDGLTSNSGSFITLNYSGKNWAYWSRNSLSDGVIQGYTQEYEAAPATFVENINYYSDASGTLLNPQPNAGNYDATGLFVRKVSITPYSGHENVTFFAHYTDEENEEDLSAYYLKPEYISISPMLNGNWNHQINATTTISDTDADGDITLKDLQNSTYLEISRAYVTNLYFDINALADSCFYDEINFKVIRSFDSKVMFNSTVTTPSKECHFAISGNSQIQYENGVIGDNWFNGLYTLEITAHSSNKPQDLFSYMLIFKITD